MPPRAHRIALACALAAVPVAAVITVAGMSPTVTTADVARSTPTPSPSVTSFSSLGPAWAATRAPESTAPTSTAPSTSPTPDNGVHVDCEKGDDSGNGTAGKPLRTIQAATGRSLSPGTRIELARGCTWNTTVDLTGDGTSSAPIVLTSYGSGALPVISGGSGASEGGRQSVVRLLGAYQFLDGVRVTNAQAVGVEIKGAHGGVRNSTIDDVGVGVLITARGAVADHVTIHDLHMVVDTPGGNDDYGAVAFDVEAHEVEIAHSSCVNCRAPSHDFGYDGGFVEVWNYGDDLDVHDNTATNVQGFLEVGGDKADASANGIDVHGNTFRTSHGGMVLHTTGDFAMPVANVRITGNTIVSTASDDPPVLDGDLSTVSFTGNTVTTASFVSHSAPATHRCNSITLRGKAELGYAKDGTERIGGTASCS